ncbi:MAG: hypothetical protein U5R06_08800 [candidate division KSB1 bacterium]|nr:hypothetical protein [candidate division KSB1 bacterium]
MSSKPSRPVSVYLLMILMLFQGLSGLAGGIGLVLDPSGKSMQIPLEWLQGSPFTTYLIPGIVLFAVLGLFPLVVFIGLLKRWRLAWYASLLIGIALMIWLTVEIMVIGYQPQPPLQVIYGLVGIGILTTVLLPSVKKNYLFIYKNY